MTPYNTLKEKSTNKNYYDDNYSASIYAMLAPSLKILTTIKWVGISTLHLLVVQVLYKDMCIVDGVRIQIDGAT